MNTGCSKAGRKSIFFHYFVYGRPFAWLCGFFFHFVIFGSGIRQGFIFKFFM